MSAELTINGRTLSVENPPYVIAEVSANHNGSIERAKQTILAAYQSGADAVKIQTYTPDTMTVQTDNPEFHIDDGLWKGRSLYDLYGEAYTPFEWHGELFAYAREIGITLFSSPFDESAVDLLHSLNAPAYKVASFELVDLPLIRYMASKGKPLLMSTGMANFEEIGEALEAARSAGCNEIALFHCISSYPTPIEAANLRSMVKLREQFGVQVGLSDHTLGTTAATVATALGATVIEKHFTLSRADGGVDSTFSLEPDELKDLMQGVTDAHASLGQASFERPSLEAGNKIFRRSIYFVKSKKAGEVIEETDIRRIRPGYGLAPKYWDEIIGKLLAKDVNHAEAVTWDAIEGDAPKG